MNTTTTSRTLAVTAFTALSLGLAAPVATQEPAPAAPPPGAPTLDSVVAEDLTSFATGMVAGVVVQGELDFLAAWGTPDRQSTDSLEATSLLASPGMTEILVAVTVRALGAAGLLDPQAPLSRILAEATGRLGQVTLDQLLSHTSGLDNAAVPAGRTWAEALDGLGDDAFVAEPGEVFSASRYSYPLAARVLERAVGMPFAEIATQAVLTPLGMGRSTFDLDTARERGLTTGYRFDGSGPVAVEPVERAAGLPVLFTSTPDVLQLLSAWMSGGIRGSSPLGAAPADVPRMDPARHFSDGLTQDVEALVPQAAINRDDLGFRTTIHLYPEQETGLFIWANGPVPGRTIVWIRSLLAEAVGDVETSMASQGIPVRRTVDPTFMPDGLDDLAEWVGLYRNGSALIGLQFSEGQLRFFDGEETYPLQGVGPATFAYVGESTSGPPLQLLRLGDRLIVLYGNLAYAWESAEVTAPGGG
ncbi:MAG: beta-lactamase family protein [Gemmatimonadetes bacterium]|nr:beta-lactamase family protein [Gemmatimonadota bacterium]